MSIGSTSSTPASSGAARAARAALEPRRAVGRERVASLLEAASALINERGYEATTMAEIAARAGAGIGSLYRFFPSKEVLAEALLRRHLAGVEAAYDEIEARAAETGADALADMLIDSMLRRQPEMAAFSALLDARVAWSRIRRDVRSLARDRIARIVTQRAPWLAEETASDVAIVLLNIMKLLTRMESGDAPATSPGAIADLRLLMRSYLAGKLAPPAA